MTKPIKCLCLVGMGRCSSRVASRRIANNITKQEGSDNDSLAGDEHDNDWGAALRRSKLSATVICLPLAVRMMLAVVIGRLLFAISTSVYSRCFTL